MLAFEATALTHGEPAADEAQAASRAAFGGEGDDLSAIPSVDVTGGRPGGRRADRRPAGRSRAGRLRGAARRLVEQGGAYVNGVQVASLDARVTHTGDGPLLVRSGKKHVRRVVGV